MVTDSISVVIPCYNAAPYLRETLDSVKAQTQQPLEVILVDDGSTDDSAAIAESYAPLVRVIRQENQGESVARNRGIDEAKGEWVAFLDADDVWHREKLDAQLGAIDRDDVIAVHTNLFLFGERSGRTRIEETPESSRYDVEQLAMRNAFQGPGSTLLVRRSRSPRYPTWTTYAEDLIYCLELVQRGLVRLVERPLTGYRQRSDCQSADGLAGFFWYQTMDRWLAMNPHLVSRESSEKIRKAWLGKAAGSAWQLKNQRRWDDYWRVRAFLRKFRGHADVDLVLKNRVYPPWIYRLYDRVARRT